MSDAPDPKPEHYEELLQILSRDKLRCGECTRYQYLRFQMDDLFSIMDVGFVYREVNAAYEKLVGAPADEIIGKHPKEIFGAGYFTEHLNGPLQRCLQGETVHHLIPNQPNAKPNAWFKVTRVPITNDDGVVIGIVNHAHDISDLKSTMEALEDSKERYRTIFENTGEQIIIFDEHGVVMDVNPAAYKRLGYAHNELVGMHISQVVEGDYAVGFPRLHKQLKNGESIRFESKRITKDKNLVPVELNLDHITFNKQSAVLSIGRDLTERKEAEERLALLGNAVEQVADAVMITTAELAEPHPLILYVNKAFCRMTGYAPDEIIGFSPRILQGPKTDRRVLDVLRSNLENGRSFHGETVNYHKDGTPFTLEWRISPIDINGRTANWIAVMRDVSRRKRMEDELIRAKELAEEANRTKSRFLANMSHEIRTPLNGVLGMLQLMKTTSIDEEQKDYIATALDSGRSLLGIIDDLLDFSKIEAGVLNLRENEFNLQSMLSSLLSGLKEQIADQDIAVSLEYLNAIPETLIGDDGRLRQVLLNIISNAVKFTSEGKILLQVSSAPIDQKLGTLRLSFTLTDSGVGIPRDKLDAIFEPFTQADDSFTRTYQGSGLGLSIVKRLVELLDGSVHIESKVGEGTSVHFFVVMRSGDKLLAGEPHVELLGTSEENSPAAKDSAMRCKILVVEDNAINSLTIIRMLEKLGHEAASVNDGRMVTSALEGGDFDLVLMDVQMPDVDGIEATRMIRNAGTATFDVDIPVIALTAYAMEGDREKFLAAGMNDYLSKPVDIRELRETIRRNLRPADCTMI